MCEAVWGGCQPQPWRNGIIFTPQMTQIPKSGAYFAGIMIQGCIHMPLRQNINNSSTLYMSNMDVGCSLRWISASTMTNWHHFHSISDPKVQNLGPTWPMYLYKGAPKCPWGHMSIAQTLWICLAKIWEAVWGGYQPQPSCDGIISTPKVTQNFEIWGQLS